MSVRRLSKQPRQPEGFVPLTGTGGGRFNPSPVTSRSIMATVTLIVLMAAFVAMVMAITSA